MAHGHAGWITRTKGVELTAVSDIDEGRAGEFAAKFSVPRVFTDFGKLLDEAPVDAVVNVTPDAQHAPLSLQAIAAGKHVLCEKPLATTYADARKMTAAAKRKGIIHMVNLSYRNNPALQHARTMVQRGDIGTPKHFEASYLQSWLVSDAWGDWRTLPKWLWRLSTKHGSKGALGDIGVHILDMAMFVLGPMASVNCRLKTFDKIKGGRIGEYVLDANDSAVIHAEAKNGATGVVHTSRWATGHYNTLLLRAYGDQGAIVVNLDKSGSEIEVCKGRDARKAQWKTLKCPAIPRIHDRFLAGIRSGRQDQPSFEDGAAVQQVLDACFASDEAGSSVKIR